MNIQTRFTLVDASVLDVSPLIHLSYWVKYGFLFREVLLGDNIPVILFEVSVHLFEYGPDKIFFALFLHSLVKIHGILVRIGKIVYWVRHIFLTG